MTLRGQVKNGIVVFEGDPAPPDGTFVEVTPVDKGASAPAALPAGGPPYPVSEDQRRALPGMIGMWKMANPPNDEAVERIIEEYRMKKYG